MAFNSRLHYICMLTILICHYVKGNYLPTGQVFLLAFPRTTMDTVQYHFFVYTMSKKQISVHLSTKNFDPNNELDYTMTVSRDNPGSYVADHRYSTEDFSTTALVRASPSQMEALQAVPVEAWGKKYMAISFE
ncbi:uncharacterized protein LOC131929524 [Physella acuta]|uniref:uncharacterized protein LOC131929524 n=1 Tax=Physella acuta TaxID=109671 RepID=UPI0027DB25F4|nr:uncharacterized protein LOC131929524 [Physella acuta]